MGWGATVPSAAYIWSALGHIPNIARQVQCQNGEVKKQEGLKEARSILAMTQLLNIRKSPSTLPINSAKVISGDNMVVGYI